MPTQRFDLYGKTALITGGAGLLGVEHAVAILECDGNVILTDISESRLSNTKKNLELQFGSQRVQYAVMDVTRLESIKNVKFFIQDKNLNIDVLINNAAIDPKVIKQENVQNSSRLENFSIEQWDREIAVGLTGAFQCSMVFGEMMSVQQTEGVILNISSDLSILSPDQRLYRKSGVPKDKQPVKPVTYSVIKAGLIGLTRYLATYWAEDGVRCNALSPGGVETDQSEDFKERIERLIPMGRMASRSEYRAAVQFLCSDASRYMNGQNLIIDGGRSIW